MIQKICIFISLWYVFDFISYGETFDYWIDPHTGQTYQQIYVPIPVAPKNKAFGSVNQTPNTRNKQNENKLRKSPENFDDLIIVPDDPYLIDLEKKNRISPKLIPRKTSKQQISASDSDELIVIPDDPNLISLSNEDPLPLKPKSRERSKLQKFQSDSEEIIVIPDDPNLISFEKKNRISSKRIASRTSKLQQTPNDSDELIVIPDDPNLIDLRKKNSLPQQQKSRGANNLRKPSITAEELIVIPDDLITIGKKDRKSSRKSSNLKSNLIDMGNEERISSKKKSINKSEPTKPSSNMMQEKDLKKDSPKVISQITPIPILEKPLLSTKIDRNDELQTTSLKPEKHSKRKHKRSRKSKTLQTNNSTNPEQHQEHLKTRVIEEHEAYLNYLKKPAKKLKFSDFVILRRYKRKHSKGKGKSNVKDDTSNDLAT